MSTKSIGRYKWVRRKKTFFSIILLISGITWSIWAEMNIQHVIFNSPNLNREKLKFLQKIPSGSQKTNQLLLLDINNDEKLEIVALTSDEQLHAWTGEGKTLPEWSINIPFYPGTFSPLIFGGDVINDNKSELLVVQPISLNLTQLLIIEHGGKISKNYSIPFGSPSNQPNLKLLPVNDSQSAICVWNQQAVENFTIFVIFPQVDFISEISLFRANQTLLSFLPVWNEVRNFWSFLFLTDKPEIIEFNIEGVQIGAFPITDVTLSPVSASLLALKGEEIHEQKIIYIDETGSIRGWYMNATPVHEWNKNLAGDINVRAHVSLIGDIDQSGIDKLILIEENPDQVHVFLPTGAYLTGWPQPLPGSDQEWRFENPFMINFDDNPDWEIAIPYISFFTNVKTMFVVYNSNGTLIDTWDFSKFNFPVIPHPFQYFLSGDVTGDHFNELIYVSDESRSSESTTDNIAIIQTCWLGHTVTAGYSQVYIETKDSDHDGILDQDESIFHTSPFLNDTDNDRLTDSQELRWWTTDPNDFDTDDDGVSDGKEVFGNSNPLLFGDNSKFIPEYFYFRFIIPYGSILGKLLFLTSLIILIVFRRR